MSCASACRFFASQAMCWVRACRGEWSAGRARTCVRLPTPAPVENFWERR
ncbi:hypothetical protein ACFPRL_35610 [Pseudoclavibacter helvolus]